MARVLVVDDDEGVRRFLADVLDDAGHRVDEAASGEEALRRVARVAYALVLTDLKMPGMDGLELLRRLRADHPDTEVIVVTAHGTVHTAVEAMKQGAFDYLQKPLSGPDELVALAERALERHRLRALSEASRGVVPPLSYGAPAMAPVLHALRRVAPTEATVLLLGASGTGKEVAARAIHAGSKRAAGPLIAVNCASLSDQLLESELFGHERGAFTGAVARRRGRVELAAGGTLFLDEVGELKPDLQARLLRVLQERCFERVGGHQTIEADVRVLAATNRDLLEMVREGRFREDLYFRLAVFPVSLPPLRARREDILPLAEALLARVGAELGRPGLRLGPGVGEALLRHPWPGNIRELANALERAAILCTGEEITDLWLSPAPSPAPAAEEGAVQTLEALEREGIRRALEASGGNRKRAAEALGIGERTLYDKLKRYELG